MLAAIDYDSSRWFERFPNSKKLIIIERKLQLVSSRFRDSIRKPIGKTRNEWIMGSRTNFWAQIPKDFQQEQDIKKKGALQSALVSLLPTLSEAYPLGATKVSICFVIFISNNGSDQCTHTHTIVLANETWISLKSIYDTLLCGFQVIEEVTLWCSPY